MWEFVGKNRYFYKLNANCPNSEKVGGDHPCSSSDNKPITVDIIAPSQDSLEKMIKGNEDDDPLPWDDDYTIKIAGSVYKVRLEGWYDDCLESRGYDKVEPNKYQDTISEDFKNIMADESGWGKEKGTIFGYVKNVPGTTYGVTYIGKKVK